MRFIKRVIVSVLVLLFFTTLSVIHLLRQFEAPEDGDDHQVRIGPDHRVKPRNKQTQRVPKPGHYQDDSGGSQGSESQIHKPPLPRPGNRDGKGSKQKRPAWERGSEIKSAWDDQEVVGKGHPWQQFHRDISQDALYSKDTPYMDELLHNLATVKIVNTSMFKGGSQVKLDFRLADGNRAIVKPMRSPRDFVYKYDNEEPFWLDQERHNAEIAAFHLDRILGFRRVPPCVGRQINLTQEVLLKSEDQELLNTFFWKDGNLCFIGKCAPWFCNQDHPICGKGDVMEMSLCQFLPSFEGSVPVFELEYPWSQGVKESLVWKGKNICLDYLKDPVWTRGRFLLDLIEQGIFDFFIRNYDRHHFDMMRRYKRRGCVLFLDNGKGFGNPHVDDATFLAPVYQCCKVRRSTYFHLKELTQAQSRLSDLLRSAMSHDPIAPVITEDHLQAMDRRLETVLQTINKCIHDHGESRVLVDHLDNERL
ncbi:glycosaminoglycan xylosylkinase-like [Acanthaster planci]|uniref:Glycosaminoglycan xylosylkinase-like n=1 Tax=Acanthaster planci TaxID=133434 RepID=A0A8B7XIH8_ACAPL|nr:glycosaminoglycan xylosylkinase-like [Acanthaster planci]